MYAIVPIKSHSERVPGKNFRVLGDKPLYEWIIRTLLSIKAIEQIIIDTDSRHEGLWKLGENPRIILKERPEELLGDYVSMNRIIQNIVESTENTNYLMTHVTNPFLSKETIEKAIEIFSSRENTGHDSLFSVSRIQGRLIRKNGSPLNHNPSNLVRTQDLEEVYLENSCLYIFSRETFVYNQSRIGLRPFLFSTPILDSIDIDTLEEWNHASLLANNCFISNENF